MRKSSPAESLIFLLRHGQIQGSEKKRFLGRTDVHLDQTGIHQALYWKKAFSSVRVETIYSSSLERCAHTAGVIANGKHITTVPALNEINMGEWDGKSFDDIKQSLPREFETRGRMIDQFRPPRGESFQDLQERVWPFFETLKKKQAGHILVVTHAGVIRVMMCGIMGLHLKEMFKVKLVYGQLFILSFPIPK
ncbi:alpha-ribazole phosphatase [Desulfobacula sp.]|uniref:alpha-ribazole phosphatase n=1 Tax=Desulfobacula sp. TaxID=2593537 RepID=UPI00262E105F|nr:alpha-ribazole phosphatase [Desulfobacula sp.]